MTKQQDNPYGAPSKVKGEIYLQRGSDISCELSFDAIPWINTLSDGDIGKLSQEGFDHPIHEPVFTGPTVGRVIEWLCINGDDYVRTIMRTTGEFCAVFGYSRHAELAYDQTQRYISHLVTTRAVDSLLSTHPPPRP